MAADRQWAHSSVPKTNSCVQPVLLRWTEGSRSGRARFPWSGFGWWREKSVAPRGSFESCRRGQNKATEAKIALRERYTSSVEVSVSGVFIFPLTPGLEESVVNRLHSCRGGSCLGHGTALCVVQRDLMFRLVYQKESKAACHLCCHQYTNTPWSLGSRGCQQCHWCGSSEWSKSMWEQHSARPSWVPSPMRAEEWTGPGPVPGWGEIQGDCYMWYHAEGCNEISCHRGMQTF